jgi:hypothetical protein
MYHLYHNPISGTLSLWETETVCPEFMHFVECLCFNTNNQSDHFSAYTSEVLLLSVSTRPYQLDPIDHSCYRLPIQGEVANIIFSSPNKDEILIEAALWALNGRK